MRKDLTAGLFAVVMCFLATSALGQTGNAPTAGKATLLLTFYAKARLNHLLDFGNREVAEALSIRDVDFYEAWRGSPETKLQILGRAISEQHRISSVRFPSAASHAEGTSGWNVAIFNATLGEEDRVEILGADEGPLEVLPSPPRRKD